MTSKYLSFIISIMCMLSSNIYAESEAQATTLEHHDLDHKSLLNYVDVTLRHLISHINVILARIDKLSIDRTIKKHNVDELVKIHEKLVKAHNNMSLYEKDTSKINGLLHSLVAISKTLEQALTDSFTRKINFTTAPEKIGSLQALKETSVSSMKKLVEVFVDGTKRIGNGIKYLVPRFKKRKKVINTDSSTTTTLEQLIKETEQHIQTSEKLIQNLGKTWVNKTYNTLAGWWHTPLFHIAPFGGTPVYPGDIAQRILIYGGNTVLIVYNLNHKLVEQIPFAWLRNSIMSVKNLLGRKTEIVEQSSPSTEPISTPSNNFVLFPEKAAHPNPDHGLLLKKDGNRIDIQERIINNKAVYCVISESSGAEFYYENLNDLLNQVSPCGTLYAVKHTLGDKTKTEYIYRIPDPLTGEYHYAMGATMHAPLIPVVNPTAEFLSKLNEKNRVDLQVYASNITDVNGNPVSPHIVIADNTVMPSQQRSIKTNPGHGWGNTFISAFSWIVEPDLRTAFTLPINTWLASYIYDDIAALKKKMYFAKEWAHCKLSGSQPRLEPLFAPSEITFDDVVGRQAIKYKLMPYVKFVENPVLALQAGIKLPRGIIFAGEPQTGKTMMAQAFLGELTRAVQKNGSGRLFRMLNVTVSELMHHGLGNILDLMKTYAPCLVFCDEFELSGAKRDENKVLLADFLTALNGFGTSSDIDKMVFFLVATNHPENIDHALQEPGRMGTHIYFEMPNATERYEFFTHKFNKLHIPTTAINVEGLVQETAACSYGTLQDLQSEIIRVAEDSKEQVSQKHVEYVLDEMVRRIVHDEYDVPQEERIALAARYGAQAFASLVLNPNKKFVAATIFKITPKFTNQVVAKNYAQLERNPAYTVENKRVLQTADNPTGMIYGGVFSYNAHETFGLTTHSEKLKLCKIALAGTVGQQVLDLDYIGFSSDELLAQKYAREIVFNGMPSDKNLWPEKVYEEKLTQVYDLIQACKAEMRALLEAHKQDYKKIVELLQKRYIIRTSDIKECFNLNDLDLVSYFTEMQSPA